MNTEQQGVLEFHQHYGCAWESTPELPDAQTLLLRMSLISEELSECMVSSRRRDMVELVDGLCDLLYVVYGTAVTMGVDLEPIFAEVQRSNMTKDGGGKDAGGKIEKGPDFTPPDIIGQLNMQGWT